ncbi:MAG: hypothetical protein ACXVMS_16000 [Flavisolibacter sp.]
MYTPLWNKYLSVIRILLKKSAKEEQQLQLNTTDFEKMGSSRKSSLSFTLSLKNKRADNLASLPLVAKDLAAVLVQDSQVNGLLDGHEYLFSMNTKYLLKIKLVQNEQQETVLPLVMEEGA